MPAKTTRQGNNSDISSIYNQGLPELAATVEQNIKPVMTEAQHIAAQTSFSGRKAVSRGTMFLAFYLWLLSGAVMLSWIAQRTQFFPGDMVITKILQKRKNPLVRKFMLGISEIGFPKLSIPLSISFAAIFWVLRFRLEAFFILLTSSSHLLNALVKRLIKRPRPTNELVTVARVINEPSFPSGHVMHYINLFGLLSYLLATNWRSGRLRNILIAICIALIAFVGPSRVYLGAHWPSDVMAGYLYGGLWFGGIMALYLRVKSWIHPSQGRTPEAMKPLQQPNEDEEE
ncbi:MAG: phosphatase PAP2 family protein [Chloroflexi bacterium]|nr:MAG: phosphatase PAP2 family protein [Chloroflexota bacterium]